MLRDAARQADRKGLTWGNSGNISCRISESAFLISATGVALSELDVQDFVCSRFQDSPQTLLSKDTSPSVETGMHAAVYQARSDVGAVLHASPFFTTLLASTELEPDPNLTTDSAYYLRRIRRVSFQPPGSGALAHEAAGMAVDCDAMILDNHGALTLGLDPEEAVRRMEILEILCRMTVYASLGLRMKTLSGDQIAALMRSLENHGSV